MAEEDNNRNHEPSFIKTFMNAQGAKEIVLVSTLAAFGWGCVVGLVPATIADRYARLHHGFNADTSCGDFIDKPAACIAGSDEGQTAAAMATFCSNILTLFFNPVIGSWSDSSGRRPVIILASALSTLPLAAFLALLLMPRMNPAVYYTALATTGLVNFPSIAFAALSDVIPEQFRASAFGVLLAGFFGGFALSPAIAVIVPQPTSLTCISLALIAAGACVAVAIVPETLALVESTPIDVASTATATTAIESSQLVDVDDQSTNSGWKQTIVDVMTRPFRDMDILNRNWSIRLLTLANLLSSMVYATDLTFFMYYVQEQFEVTSEDIAGMFFTLGVAGILIQGVLLQPLISLLGENKALILSYVSGTLHNLLYGVARKKSTLYVAMILSQLTKTNFPLVSSLASREDASQQGRIQGALFAVGALGNAVGPVTMKWLQEHFAETHTGALYLYATVLYFIGTAIVTILSLFPAESTETGELHEPLLLSTAPVEDEACGEDPEYAGALRNSGSDPGKSLSSSAAVNDDTNPLTAMATPTRQETPTESSPLI